VPAPIRVEALHCRVLRRPRAATPPALSVLVPAHAASSAPVHAACPAHEPPRQLASARAFAPCLPSRAPTLRPPRAVLHSPAPAKPHPLCSASRPTLALRRSHPRHSCAPPARTPARAARPPALPPAGPHTRCLLQPIGPPARHLLRARRSLCLRLPRPTQRLPSCRRSPGAACSRGCVRATPARVAQSRSSCALPRALTPAPRAWAQSSRPHVPAAAAASAVPPARACSWARLPRSASAPPRLGRAAACACAEPAPGRRPASASPASRPRQPS
jgi:hypothetical protein